MPQGSGTAEPPTVSATREPAEAGEIEVEVVAQDLDVPWALAFAPDGRLFFTERGGRIRMIEDGNLVSRPVATIDVAATGESGLLGIALDPEFRRNHFLYVYYSYRKATFTLANRVVRFVEDGGTASDPVTILDGIPAGAIHSGGRIGFGPDGKLYITTGDAASAGSAQDQNSLGGKILRINPDGSIPEDNPFAGSPVYSFGHRNPQGIAWHPSTKQLFATEHGQVGNDEVNIIEKGMNYGWPVVQSKANREEFRDPIAVFNPAVAPSGAAFLSLAGSPWNGDLFVAALRGQQLIRIDLQPPDFREVGKIESLFQNQYGRLRDIKQGPDGWLYVATSNRDGRGSPMPEDDRILRLRPKLAGIQ